MAVVQFRILFLFHMTALNFSFSTSLIESMLTRPSRSNRILCISQKDEDKLSPVEFIKQGGRLTSRGQFIRGISLATFVAIGGNFLGVTSLLLSLDGGQFADFAKLDVLVPVRSYRRCWNPKLGFEFQYNGQWLADQRLVRRAAERVELENPLDLPPPREARRYDSDPVIAFGPPGSRGEENISVVVSEAARGFQLTMLGSVQSAAEELLRTKIAPEGSDKTAVLLTVDARTTDDTLYYTFEYTVRSPRWYRHNLASFAAKGGKLYTINAQSPEDKWSENESDFQQTIKSFRVI